LKDDGTRYYPPGTYHVAAIESASFKGGVGMYVDEEKDRQGRFIIVDTLDGFPAFNAGLASGDRLVKAGGKEVKGLEFHQLVELIIGDIGTPLSLTIERPGSSSPREVTLERVALNPNPRTFVTTSLDNSLGYLKYKFLGFRMEPETHTALQAMKTEKGLVMDLRNNAGYPEAAISLSGLFLPKDTPIATQVFKSSEKLFVAKNEGAFKLPLVILINENSSSASTIMACALRSAGRAKIVGSPSRWRYMSNEKFPLADGSVLTVTTSYYRLPDGRILRNRGEGATPDFLVPRDPFGGNDLAKDGQVQRALQVLQDIIRGEKNPG
jgi:carboxyl-terminal processing protease